MNETVNDAPAGYAADAARLQAENESMRADCELMRVEAERVGAINRQLRAKVEMLETECSRLRAYAAAIERSKPWRALQALRGLVGRRW